MYKKDLAIFCRVLDSFTAKFKFRRENPNGIFCLSELSINRKTIYFNCYYCYNCCHAYRNWAPIFVASYMRL